MPTTPEAAEQPHFIIDTTADDAVATRLRTLERRITRSPELFKNALDSLGELATAKTIEIDKLNERDVTLKRGEKDMLSEYFGQRYDLEMSFDEATESALSADTTHQKLLSEVRGKKANLIQRSKSKTPNPPNYAAIPAREALRRYRLEFYIGRVAAKTTPSSSKTAKGKLRSTG